MKNLILGTILISSLFYSCNISHSEVKKIDITHCRILHETHRAVTVTLLNVYRKAGDKDDPALADLYVCKTDDEIDSVLVLGLKSTSPKEIDKIRGSDFVISFDSIPKYRFIKVFVPSNFKVPNNVKCAFGWIAILKEG